VLVIVDESADPEFAAADLLSQAEHGPDSQVLLVATDSGIASRVIAALDRQLDTLPRRAIVEQALAHAALIIVRDLDEAIAISNRYAPEHLILLIADARARVDSVVAAGSVFVGPWAPESVGDYCSGTNHVLPTYGYASRYSSLGLNDFLRTMTVQELTPAGLRRLGPIAVTLAQMEGLDAHAQAVSFRLRALDGGAQP
jgi:histidinol dehydrogenase